MRLFIDLILLIVSPPTLRKIKQFQNPEIIPRPFEQCFDLNLKFELYKERFFLLIFIWTEWFKSKTSSLSCSALVDCYINQVLY